jgi:hypothetical protein
MFCTLVVLWLFKNQRVYKTFIDPLVITLFQVVVTFFILLFIGLLSIPDLVAYLLLFTCILLFNKIRVKRVVFLNDYDWVDFVKYFFLVSLACNIYLLYTKGFIYAAPNPGLAKVTFYQGAGVFKRLNEVGVILFGMSSIFLILKGKKIHAAVYFLYCLFLMLTLGSKGGLIGFFFIIGAFLQFHNVKFSGYRLALLGIISVGSIFLIFSLLFEGNAIEAFYYRFVSYADGPVYYFAGKLNIDRPIDYPLDVLLTNLRVRPELKYTGLGYEIISSYFRIWDENNKLFGPNPQFIVESKIVTGAAYYLYIIAIAFVIIIMRKTAGNAFAFMMVNMIFNPFLIDSQAVFTNLLSVGIVIVMACAYKYLKDFSRLPSHETTKA